MLQCKLTSPNVSNFFFTSFAIAPWPPASSIASINILSIDFGLMTSTWSFAISTLIPADGFLKASWFLYYGGYFGSRVPKFNTWLNKSYPTLLIYKSDTTTTKKILATLYSEASMNDDNLKNKFLVLYSGVIPERRKKWILVKKIFAFEGLTSLNKWGNPLTPLRKWYPHQWIQVANLKQQRPGFLFVAWTM